MEMILIYATKPKLTPLAFVKDSSDARAIIERNVCVAAEKMKAAEERAEKSGGDVPTLAMQRWKSARIMEVDICIEDLDSTSGPISSVAR